MDRALRMPKVRGKKALASLSLKNGGLKQEGEMVFEMGVHHSPRLWST